MGQDNTDHVGLPQQPKRHRTCHCSCKNSRRQGAKCLSWNVKGKQLAAGKTLFAFVLLLALNVIITLSSLNGNLVEADNVAAAPALDMSMLANLASSIGSNPQIMGLVTSFLNSNVLKPAVSAPPAPVSGGMQPEMGGMPDVDPNSIVQDNTSGLQQQQIQSNTRPDGLSAGGSELPVRRWGKPTVYDQQLPVQPAPQAPTTSVAVQTVAPVASPVAPPAAPAAPAAVPIAPPAPVASATPVVPAAPAPPTGAANPLGGLLSMLPSVLSSLSAAGPVGGLGGLSGLGGLGGLLGSLIPSPSPPSPPSPPPLTPPVQQQQQQPQPAGMIPNRSGWPNSSSQNPMSPNDVAAPLATLPPPPPPQPAMQPPPPISALPPVAPQQQQQQQPSTAVPSTSPNSAQSVINQVLTAYALGQIPNELIQLGLSGRVPPQVIELALSGQVPPQIIQMVITGQVPMSMINTFLGTMQQQQQQAGGGSRASADSNNTSSNALKSTSSSGVFATTRSLFEALFRLARRNESTPGNRGGLSVPTPLGSIPLKMPSLPNMRNFGRLVGGTISNLSSMIPF